jgi:electron transport complex protein RnfC
MYWFARARNFGKTQEYHIFDCIECGCCSYVCPSRIPLVQYFRFAKSEIWAREREKNAADGAKARFEFKQEREEREKAEKAEKLARAAAVQAARKAAEAAAAAAAGEAPLPAAPGSETASAAVDAAKDAKKATIEAAMARARAQREAVQPKNVEALSNARQKEIDEIEARRQAARMADAAGPAPTTPAGGKAE